MFMGLLFRYTSNTNTGVNRKSRAILRGVWERGEGKGRGG
jgi:hypothetical protein